MHDFQRERSPRGEPHRGYEDDRRPASQDRVHDQPSEYYRLRHGYSRSPPPRNDLPYDDLPDEDPRHREVTRRRHGYGDDRGSGYRERRSRSRDDYRQREDYHARPSHSRDGSRGHYDDSRYDSRRHHHRRGSESYSDHEHHGRPRSRRRSRSYPRSPPRHPGSPSDTVILEGLPGDVSVNELQSCVISSSTLSPDDIVDIRIPPSGGHRRAFIQFHTVNDAARFVDRHFPEIIVELPARGQAPDGRTPLFLHFARSRDEGDRRHPADEQWPCPSCDFSNFATRTRCKMCGYSQSSAMSGYQQVLTGETDASNDPSQFLVVYPLDACVTEEVLEFGMKKLEVVEKKRAKDSDGSSKPLKSTAPSGDAPGYGARRHSLHRVFLIRDKSSGHTLKYGFAEFWTVEDAMAALTKFRMTRSFTIGGAPVAVYSIHMGVFVPEIQQVVEDDRFSFFPLFNPSLRVKYWDPRVYASPRIVNSEPPAKSETTQTLEETNNSETKKVKKRKADGNLNSGAAKKPVAMAGQMAMWQKKSEELRDGARDAGAQGLQPATEEGRPKSPAPSPANDGPIKITLGGMAKAAANTELPGRAAPAPVASQPPTTPKDAPVSYADRDKVACLLCMMKYKSLEELATHERSGNHKKALADKEKVEAAAPRLVLRDKRMQAKKAEEEKTQYRDRAKERREVFNQPKKPAAQPSKPKGGGKVEAAKSAEAKKPEVKPSKGSAMMAKMGWTGQGLGASGEGRTEIVAAHAYREGVGLGVEGGDMGDAGAVAAGRTGGYKEYVEGVQEKARARYNKMSE